MSDVQLLDPKRSQAVLVGASAYRHLPPLPATSNNVAGLAECLRDGHLLGLPKRSCRVVVDPKSLAELLDPIEDAAATAEDTLIVYFAGHGMIHPRTGELLLALVTSSPGKSYSAVEYNKVRDILADARALRRVAILDCCYSGRAMDGGMADPDALADGLSETGTFVLASTPPNRQALAPPGERYTAFTGELIELLRAGVPGGQEFLDLNEIYRHTRRQLDLRRLPLPQKREGNTGGGLALARNVRWRPPLPAIADHEPDVITQVPTTSAAVPARSRTRRPQQTVRIEPGSWPTSELPPSTAVSPVDDPGDTTATGKTRREVVFAPLWSVLAGWARPLHSTPSVLLRLAVAVGPLFLLGCLLAFALYCGIANVLPPGSRASLPPDVGGLIVGLIVLPGTALFFGGGGYAGSLAIAIAKQRRSFVLTEDVRVKAARTAAISAAMGAAFFLFFVASLLPWVLDNGRVPLQAEAQALGGYYWVGVGAVAVTAATSGASLVCWVALTRRRIAGSRLRADRFFPTIVAVVAVVTTGGTVAADALLEIADAARWVAYSTAWAVCALCAISLTVESLDRASSNWLFGSGGAAVALALGGSITGFLLLAG